MLYVAVVASACVTHTQQRSKEQENVSLYLGVRMDAMIVPSN